MEKKTKKISLIRLLDIRFADPISALSLIDTYVIFGTMMGNITLYSIQDNKIYILSELSSENIVDISYSPNDKLINVAIGDEEVIKYQINFNSNSKYPLSTKVKNYSTETEHNKYCENAFIMLSYNIFFRVQLTQPEEGNVTITNIDSEFEIRDLNNNDCLSGTLPMTNYSVPLDFDSEKFSWVEFLSDKERNLCIANLGNKLEKPIKLLLQRSFGHISHFKFLPGNKFILVRNLNICEIRFIDDHFTLLKSFKNFGDEVYAIDVIFLNEIKNNNSSNDNEYSNMKNNNNDAYLNINERKSQNNIEQIKKENIINKGTTNAILSSYNNNRNNDDFIIIFLDIDGGVSLYENGKIYQFFNLYDIKDIKQDEKNKKFFSMGYSYYIRYNLNYCVISSDHGCYILKID